MISLGLQMLRADKVKFFAMILAVAMSVFLMQNQASIMLSVLSMTGAQIRDVSSATLWVMEPDTECFDQAKPLPASALYNVRGTPGVAWAVPLMKVDIYARADTGKLNLTTVLGVDDSTLIGLPPTMVEGQPEAIRERNTVFIDPLGAELMFPGEKSVIGHTLRIGPTTLRIVGQTNASAPFVGLPVLHMTATTAMTLRQGEDRAATFILGAYKPGTDTEALCATIQERFHLRAHTDQGFMDASVAYYAKQGIPMLFGLTILIGLIVGSAITGQTFMMFIKENARHLAVLKVVGTTGMQFWQMLLAQSGLVMLLGSCFGTALAALTCEAARGMPFLRGIYLPLYVCGLTCGALTLLSMVAVYLSFRAVQKLEPAAVFRS
jgi:putative ABC transport system permease protein